jgi:hypothetical protein
MESDVTPAEALAEAERVTARLWTHYPPTPAWYYPAGGAWYAGFVLVVGGLHDRPLLLIVAIAALFALSAWFLRWYTTYRGTFPRLRSAPAEFRPAIRLLVAGHATLLVAVAVLYVTAGLGAVALLTFCGVTAGLYLYERAYEAAAAATRERLE